MALVGSWARGTAPPDSDVDLVLVVSDPAIYLTDDTWLANFGAVRRIEREDWGLVQSRQVFYAGGPEVGFGLTARRWTAIDPVDEGTAQVVADGVRVLLNRDGDLERLIATVRQATDR